MTVPEKWNNPFAVRHVRPGALPYLFPQGLDAETLVHRFLALGRRGSVLGPHGSGKSTLLATLVPALREAGFALWQATLHDGQQSFPAETFRELCRLPLGNTCVVIDGYEQLGWLARRQVRWLCWRRDWGLLVTSHRPVGLPVLVRTDVSPAAARRVITCLRPGTQPPSEDELSARLRTSGGNLREVLFEMYDDFERTRRKK
jgi:hypothetical protein